MKKQLALTFLFGALTGGGITAFIFTANKVIEFLPREVKVLTKTEYKTLPSPSMDVPKYPEELGDAGYPEEESNKYDSTEETPDAVSSQMERFERSLAGEAETAPAVVDDTSAIAPEEAPAENIPPENPGPEDSQEDETED